MNSIASLNADSLLTHIDDSKRKLKLYSSLRKICRVVIPLFGLFLLGIFGLLDPRTLPISSTLLFLAYFPSLEVTEGTFERWSSEVEKEMDKQTRIRQGLLNQKTIYEAFLDAILITDPPTLEKEMEEVRKDPGSDEKRKKLWEAKKTRALHRLENGRRKVERAYIEFIRDHPDEQRKLSDFGTYKRWHLEYLMDDLPFTVFVTKTGDKFTNEDTCSSIFT